VLTTDSDLNLPVDWLHSGLVNGCWQSPAQSFIVLVPPGPMTGLSSCPTFSYLSMDCIENTVLCCVSISCSGNALTTLLPSTGRIENTVFPVIALVKVLAKYIDHFNTFRTVTLYSSIQGRQL
jgi:hypothetical protein